MELHAPGFAESNDYVFVEVLGLGDEQVMALYREGVAADSPDKSLLC